MSFAIRFLSFKFSMIQFRKFCLKNPGLALKTYKSLLIILVSFFSHKFLIMTLQFKWKRLPGKNDKELNEMNPSPVILVNKSVIENSVNFMNPQTQKFVNLWKLGRWHQQNATDHPSKVSQVKHIVRLGGCRQEVSYSIFVHTHSGCNQHLVASKEDWFQMFCQI